MKDSSSENTSYKCRTYESKLTHFIISLLSEIGGCLSLKHIPVHMVSACWSELLLSIKWRKKNILNSGGVKGASPLSHRVES